MNSPFPDNLINAPNEHIPAAISGLIDAAVAAFDADRDTSRHHPNTRTTTAAWRIKPTWYQVSTQDRTINPELERFLAKRMRATTIELASSHLSLLSHPREIADLILAAAGHRG